MDRKVNDREEPRTLTNKYETDIKLVGDLETIRAIVLLLSYIRNVIDEGREQDISVRIGHIQKSEGLGMSVNNMEVPDFKSRDSISIN